jgi:hypothetical protein
MNTDGHRFFGFIVPELEYRGATPAICHWPFAICYLPLSIGYAGLRSFVVASAYSSLAAPYAR